MRFKRIVIRALHFVISICILGFGFSSCAFIGDFLDEMFGSSSINYSLTVDFEYHGPETIYAGSPIIFWIMPLDENGDMMDDPYNPDGPPLREELYVFVGAGSVSTTLKGRDYGILAYVDANGDGNLNLLEHYVIYDGISVVYEQFDKIDLSNQQSIYVWFDDTYEWHAVFTRSPREGDHVPGNFWAHGGFLSGQINKIEVYVQGSYRGPATIDYIHNYWQFLVDTGSLTPGGPYELKAVALDVIGGFIDEFKVNFYLD